MATKVDDSDYLSPPKRLKLDNSANLDVKNVSNDCLESSSQENNSTLVPEGLSSINFDLPDIPCNSPSAEVDGLDLVEPLNPADDPGSDILNDTTNDMSRDDDDDEVSSTVSNLSDISGFSDISGLDWKSGNFSGTLIWIQKQMASGINPRDVLTQILGSDARFPEQIDDQTLWRVVLNMVCEPKRRQRLRHISSFSDVIHLLKTCSKIIVLTGAGVSVSCGIPDFRSRDGIYSRLAIDFPNLPDPQAMFDIAYFKQDPRPFFKFAREIYPGQFKPSPCHRFIKMLERHGKLLRNYSQNIDTLEQVAGIENVIECHGSFATASCTTCGYKVSSEAIKEDVFQQNIPLCLKCPSESRGVMKPDIVFFGEGLPDSFHSAMALDKNHCDLLIVIGSSLKVRPVALIPNSLPPSVPQILINRERLSHLNFDVELLGDGDVIIDTICRALEGDWMNVCCRNQSLAEAKELNPPPTMSPVPLFRNVLSGECSEGEMSIDSTRDSGVGSTSRSGRQASVDSRMEEDVEDDLSNTDAVVPMSAASQRDLPSVVTTTITTSSSSVYEERIADNVAECCSVLRSSSTSCTQMQRSVRSSPASSSAHAHSSIDTIQRINFDSGGETILASPSIETRLDCENSVNNIVVEEGRCNRHMSIDSTRDSGIGEGSNSSNERHMSVDSNSLTVQRISLATRLPENSYHMVSKGCYIFPGAEVYSSREDVSSDSVDSESEDSDSNPPI